MKDKSDIERLKHVMERLIEWAYSEGIDPTELAPCAAMTAGAITRSATEGTTWHGPATEYLCRLLRQASCPDYHGPTVH